MLCVFVLVWSAGNGHSSCLRLLIKNAESPGDIDVCDRQGRTALMYVAAQGHLDCLNILLNSAANVNIQDHNRNTALHRAVRITCCIVVFIITLQLHFLPLSFSPRFQRRKFNIQDYIYYYYDRFL